LQCAICDKRFRLNLHLKRHTMKGTKELVGVANHLSVQYVIKGSVGMDMVLKKHTRTRSSGEHLSLQYVMEGVVSVEIY